MNWLQMPEELLAEPWPQRRPGDLGRFRLAKNVRTLRRRQTLKAVERRWRSSCKALHGRYVNELLGHKTFSSFPQSSFPDRPPTFLLVLAFFTRSKRRLRAPEEPRTVYSSFRGQRKPSRAQNFGVNSRSASTEALCSLALDRYQLLL